MYRTAVWLSFLCANSCRIYISSWRPLSWLSQGLRIIPLQYIKHLQMSVVPAWVPSGPPKIPTRTANGQRLLKKLSLIHLDVYVTFVVASHTIIPLGLTKRKRDDAAEEEEVEEGARPSLAAFFFRSASDWTAAGENSVVAKIDFRLTRLGRTRSLRKCVCVCVTSAEDGRRMFWGEFYGILG